jgi:hypothetical protein
MQSVVIIHVRYANKKQKSLLYLQFSIQYSNIYKNIIPNCENVQQYRKNNCAL